MWNTRKKLVALPAIGTLPGDRARRAALREGAMLWAMRGAMLAYGLVMVVAAEAAIAALRRLF